jgi:hypothetical protein
LYGHVSQPHSASEMHPHTNAAEAIGLVMKTPEHPRSTHHYVPLHSNPLDTLQGAKGCPSTQLSPASILSLQSFFPCIACCHSTTITGAYPQQRTP